MRDDGAQTRSGRRHALLAPEVSASRTGHGLIRAAETRSFQAHGETRLQYGDVGIFFISVLALALACRLAVHLHLLSQEKLLAPPLTLQIVISLSLLATLFLIVRVRHGRSVW